MNDYRQNIKNQGSIPLGGALIFMGLALTALSIYLLTIFASRDISYKIHIFITLGLSLVIITLGVINAYRGLKSLKVMRNGKVSTCKVVDIIYGRGDKKTYRVVYKGESGQEHMISVFKSLDLSETIEIGDTLKCTIHDEDCYVYLIKMNNE